jgi:hypothetical protein
MQRAGTSASARAGGKSFYILVVKDSQWAQLENHPISG